MRVTLTFSADNAAFVDDWMHQVRAIGEQLSFEIGEGFGTRDNVPIPYSDELRDYNGNLIGEIRIERQ